MLAIIYKTNPSHKEEKKNDCKKLLVFTKEMSWYKFLSQDFAGWEIVQKPLATW